MPFLNSRFLLIAVGALVFLSVLFFVPTPSAEAAIPEFINYQSRLRDISGDPVTGTTTIRFSIYNNATLGTPTSTPSSTGPLLWTEIYDQSSGECSYVDPDDDGYFTVKLGSCTSFPDYLNFDTDTLYVGVTIESDTESFPRAQLGIAPFAFTSERVLGTEQSAIGTTTPQGDAVLTVEATSTNAVAAVIRGIAGQIADLFRVVTDTGRQLVTLTAEGLFGIGTSTPSATLSVAGDALIDGPITASTFTATSTTATSTFPFLSATALSFNNDYLTDLTGDGLTVQNNALVVATTTLDLSPANIALGEGQLLVGDETGSASATSTLFISEESNVGIGTTTPTSALSVVGDTELFGDLLVTGTSTFAGDVIPREDNVYSLGTADRRWKDLYVGPGTIYVGDSDAFGTLGYSISEQYILFDPDGDTLHDIVFDDQGHVGIGTTTPESKLTIDSGDISTTTAFTITDLEYLTTGSALRIDSTSSSTADRNLVEIVNSNTASTNTTVLYIEQASAGLAAALLGNVAINTTNSDTALTVDGAITLASTTPQATSSALYNLVGTLFWNGLSVDTAFEQVAAVSVDTASTSGSFNVANTAFVQSTSTAAQDITVRNIRFNDDGTKLFYLGNASTSIYQYDLSTPYDISTTHFSTSTVITVDDNLVDLAFNISGTKLFILGNQNRNVYEYDLGSPYDITSIAFVQSRGTSPENQPRTVTFNNDGTKMYISGRSTDTIREYDLSTAFDISTASHLQSTSTLAVDDDVRGHRFNNDGTKMFIAGNQNNAIFEYDLSAPYDVSTAAFSQSTSTPQDSSIVGLEFNNDGTAVYLTGDDNDAIYQYSMTVTEIVPGTDIENSAELVYLDPELGAGYFAVGTSSARNLVTVQGGIYLASTTPINTSYAIYNQGGDLYWNGSRINDQATTTFSELTVTGSTTLFDLFVEDNAIFDNDITVNGDIFTSLTQGSVLFIGEDGLLTEDNDALFFEASTTSFAIGTSTPLATLTVEGNGYISGGLVLGSSTPVTTESALYNLENTLYWNGLSVDTAFEQVAAYVSGPVELDTASYFTESPLNASTTEPQGITFGDDGSKLFVVGSELGVVQQYNLLLPYEIATANGGGVIDVSGSVETPLGIAFNDDGSRMYLSSATSSGVVHQFDLDVPWDLSATTTLAATSSVAFPDPVISSVEFNQDGTKFFYLSNSSEAIFEYDMGTAYDITTLAYVDVLISGINDPYGFSFIEDGSRLWVADDTTNTLYEYELDTPYSFSIVSLTGEEFDFSTFVTQPRDIATNDDGSNLIVVDESDTTITQFALSGDTDVEDPGSIDLVYLNPAVGNGRLAIGQDNAPNALSVDGGIYISSSTPANVLSALYNVDDDLYWNGNELLQLVYDSEDDTYVIPAAVPIIIPTSATFNNKVTHKQEVTNEGDTRNKRLTRQFYEGREAGSILFLEQECALRNPTTDECEITFDDPYLSEDNEFLYYDFYNRRVGIGTNEPTNALTVDGTAEFVTGIITSYMDEGVIPVVGINQSLRDSDYLYFDSDNVAVETQGADFVARETLPRKVSGLSADILGNCLGCSIEGATDIAIHGKYAFVTSGTNDDISWIDISNPASPRELTSIAGSAIITDPSAVAALGSYVYAISEFDNALHIYDASDVSAGLVEVASYDRDQCEADNGIGKCPMDSPKSLYVTPNHVYMTSPNDNGFAVLDVTDKTKPSLAAGVTSGSSGAKLNGAYDIVVQDDFAYVSAEGDNAIVIFNVSDPNSPVEEAFIEDTLFTTMINPRELAVHNGYLFVLSDGNNQLVMLDVQDISNMSFVDTWGQTDCAAIGCSFLGASDLTVAGDYVYTTHETTDTLIVLYYRDDANGSPLLYASHQDIGGAPEAIEAVGKYLYIAGGLSDQFQVFSLAGLKAPGATIGTLAADDVHISRLLSVTGAFEAHNINTALGGLRLDGLDTQGVLFGGTGGLLSQDADNFYWDTDDKDLTVVGNSFVSPAEPSVVGVIDDANCGGIATTSLCALQGASDVHVVGNYAYVSAEEDDGFSIIDITVPSTPVFVNSQLNSGSEFLDGATGIKVQDGLVYVTSGVDDALTIYDASDPTDITQVGYITDSDCDAAEGGDGCALKTPQDVYVVGNYAYVASFNDNGVSVFDVSNPEDPTHIDSLFASSTPSALLTGANYLDYVNGILYVTAYTDEAMVTIDASAPNDLQFLHSFTNTELEGAKAIKVRGHYAYIVSELDQSFAAVDITDPSNPTVAGLIDNDTCGECNFNAPSDLEIVGDYAYVTINTTLQGISVLDITDPTDINEVAFLADDVTTNLEEPNAIHIVGKYGYVATGGTEDALTVIDVSGFEGPSGDFGTLTVDELDVWGNIVALGETIANRFFAGSGGIVSSGAVYINQDELFVNDGNITISQSEPNQVTILTDAECDAIGTVADCALQHANDVAVDTNRIHVYVSSSIDDGITKIDVSNKTNPSPVSTIDLADIQLLQLMPEAPRSESSDIDRPIPLLLAAQGGSSSGINIVLTEDTDDSDDDDDYDEMSVLSSVKDSDCDTAVGGAGCALNEPTAMEIVYHPLGDIVVVGSTQEQGIAVINVSSSTNPLHITSIYDADSSETSLASVDDVEALRLRVDQVTEIADQVNNNTGSTNAVAVLSELNEAITMFSLLDADGIYNPRAIARIRNGDNGIQMNDPTTIEVDDDVDQLVYITSPSVSTNPDNGAITIIDIGDLNNPRQVGYLENEDLSGASSIEQNGDDLFIGVDDGLLQVNVANLNEPVVVSHWEDGVDVQLGNISDVEFDRGYIYVVTETESALGIASLRHIRAPGGFFDNLYVRGKLGIDGPIVTDELVIEGNMDVFGNLQAREMFTERGLTSLGDIILDGDLIMDTNTLTPDGEVGEDGSGRLNDPSSLAWHDRNGQRYFMAGLYDGDGVTAFEMDEGEDPDFVNALYDADCDAAIGGDGCALNGVNDIAVSSDGLLVATSELDDGIAVIDANNPLALLHLASLYDDECDAAFDIGDDSFLNCALENPREIALAAAENIAGNWVYVANDGNDADEEGVSVIHMGTDGNLTYRSQFTTDDAGIDLGDGVIDVNDDLLVIASKEGGGLTVIDVSDKDNPQMLSHLDASNFSSIDEAMDIQFLPNNNNNNIDEDDDSSVIIYTGVGNGIDDHGGFVLVDLSDPNSPMVVSDYDISDLDSWNEGIDLENPTAIEVLGSRLYMTLDSGGDGGGVIMFDITEIENTGDMEVIGELSDNEFLQMAQAADVAVTPSQVVVAGRGDNGIQIIDRPRGDIENAEINQLAAGNANVLTIRVDDLDAGSTAVDSLLNTGRHRAFGDFVQSPRIQDVLANATELYNEAGSVVSTAIDAVVSPSNDSVQTVIVADSEEDRLVALYIQDFFGYDILDDSNERAILEWIGSIDDGSGITEAEPANFFTRLLAIPTAIAAALSDTRAILDGVSSVAIKGNLVVATAGDGDGISLVDVTDPANMVLVGALSHATCSYQAGLTGDTCSLDSPQDVEIDGDFAFVVTTESDNLAVIDISDPAVPTFYASFTGVDGDPVDLELKDGYAFIVNEQGDSIQVVDVRDPLQMYEVSSMNDNSSRELNGVNSIEIVGEVAYVTAGDDDGFALIDISDPTNLVYLHEEENVDCDGRYTEGCALDGASEVTVMNGLAYVTAENDDGITVFDVSSSTRIEIIDTLYDTASLALDGAISITQIPGGLMVGASVDRGVTLLELPKVDTSYVKTNYLNALYGNILTDLNVGGAISVLGNVDIGSTFSGQGITVRDKGVYSYGDITIDGELDHERSYTNMICEGEGSSCDLDDPIGFHTDGEIMAVVFDGTSNLDGFTLLDVSDPSDPEFISTVEHNNSGTVLPNLDGTEAVWVNGDYLYYLASNGIGIFDISDPFNATTTDHYEDSQCDLDVAGDCALDPGGGNQQLLVEGNYAYVTANGDQGIGIFDISDPANITHVGSVYDDASSNLLVMRDLVYNDGYLYTVSNLYDSLEVVDVTDPANPTHVRSVAHDGSTVYLNDPTGLELKDDTLYATFEGSPDGVMIFDISDPANPVADGFVLESSAVELTDPQDLVIDGDDLYVIGADSVALFDISDPDDPEQVDSMLDNALIALSDPVDILISDGFTYILSNGDEGISIFDKHKLTAPQILAQDITITGDLATNFSSGSMLFVGDSGVVSQAGGQLYWDDTNDRFGVRIDDPNAALAVRGGIELRSSAPDTEDDVLYNQDGVLYWDRRQITNQFTEVYTDTTVYGLDLSTVTLDHETTVDAETDNLADFSLSPDGTDLYVIAEPNNNSEVVQYALATPFDLTTKTFVASTSVNAFSQDAVGGVMSSSGTHFYVSSDHDDSISVYELPTAFDISVMNFAGKISIFNYDDDPAGLAINDIDTKLYLSGRGENVLVEFEMSSPNDLSTATFVATSTFSDTTSLRDVAFAEGGQQLFAFYNGDDTVYLYNLSEAYDTTTLSSTAQSYDASGEENASRAVYVNGDEQLLIIGGQSGLLGEDTFHTYTTGQTTGTRFNDIELVFYDPDYGDGHLAIGQRTASNILSVNGGVYLASTTPANTEDALYNLGIGLYWDTDRIVTDNGAATLTELTLSNNTSAPTTTNNTLYSVDELLYWGDGQLTTAFTEVYTDTTVFGLDFSSVTRIATSTVTEETNNLTDFTFSQDGTRVYVIGEVSGVSEVVQYELGTPFDLTTKTFVASTSINAFSQDAVGGVISNSGTHFYVSSDHDDSISVYELPGRFNISVMNFGSKISINGYDDDPGGLAINDLDTKLYITGRGENILVEFEMPEVNDFANATVVNTETLSDGTSLRDVSFGENGQQLFVFYNGGDTTYTHDLAVAYDTSTMNASAVQSYDSGAFETASRALYVVEDQSLLIIAGQAGSGFGDGFHIFETASSTGIREDDLDYVYYDPVYGNGSLVLGTTTASTTLTVDGVTTLYQELYALNESFFTQLASFSDALTVASSTPTATSSSIYNQAGTLYWSGLSVDTAFEQVEFTTEAIEAILPYDVSGAVLSQSTSTQPQATSPLGIRFNDDGTKVFISGILDVFEYDLSVPYNISTSVFSTSTANDLLAQDFAFYSPNFNDDGTKLYVLGFNSSDIFEYDLGSAYDISSTTFVQSTSTNEIIEAPRSFTFNDDGTRLFVTGVATSSGVYTFTLSAPYDISTTNFLASTTLSEDTAPIGIHFNADGTELIINGSEFDAVYQYALSAPYDVSTTTLLSSTSTSAQDPSMIGLEFNASGTAMYTLGVSTAAVYEYEIPLVDAVPSETIENSVDYVYLDPEVGEGRLAIGTSTATSTLTVAGDVSIFDQLYAYGESLFSRLATFSDALTIASSSPSATSSSIYNEDGTLYWSGLSVDTAFEQVEFVTEAIDAILPYDIRTAAFLQSTTTPEVGSASGISFNDDGEQMFVTSATGTSLHEYTLSVPYDISTAAFGASRALTEDSEIHDVMFNDSGTRMYVVGASSTAIHEYIMPVPFDIVFATLVHSTTTAPYETSPRSASFNSDGTQMFVTGLDGGGVTTYSLSSAYDISTAAFSASTTISEDSSLSGIRFNTTGSEMFILGSDTDTLYGYDLGIAFDVSTASLVNSTSTAAHGSAVSGFTFNDDGTELYTAASTTDSVYQYELTVADAVAPMEIQNSTELVYLNPEIGAGNFALGTTTAQNILTVQGGIYVASTTPNTFANSLYNLGGALYWNTERVWSGSGAQGQTLVFDGAGVPVATSSLFVASSGHVGIGTTTPSSALMVVGTTTLAGDLLPDANNTYSLGSSALRWKEVFVGPGTIHVGEDGNFGSFGYSTSSNYLIFDPDGDTTHEVVFTDLGQVGIGTTTPTANLVVNGTTGQNLFQIATSTNQNILVVDQGGNVGIGTTSPDDLFHIYGTASNIDLRIENIQADGNTNLVLKNDGTQWVIGARGEANDGLVLRQGGVSHVFVDTSGNVGIGTTTPSEALSVVGDAFISSNLSVGDSVTDSNSFRALNLAATNAVMRVLRVGGSGDPAVELIGRATPDGTDTTYWDFYADYTDDSFNIRRRTPGGANYLTIVSSGEVGIGTTTPSETLTVDGDMHLTGAFYDGFNSPGNPGYVLQSTATGTQWVASTTLVAVDSLWTQNGTDIYYDLGNVGIGTTSPTALLELDGSGVTTGNAIAIPNLDNIATGTGLFIQSDKSGGIGGALAEFNLTNTSSAVDGIRVSNAGSGRAIEIESTGNASALSIDSDVTSNAAVGIQVDSLTTGYGMLISSNSDSTSINSLLTLNNSNDGPSGNIALEVIQDGWSAGVKIDQNGEQGVALTIDSEQTINDIIAIDASQMGTGNGIDIDNLDSLTTGSGLRVDSNSANTNARNLVEIINDNTAATGATGLFVQQDSTAPAAAFLGDVGIGTTSPATTLSVAGSGYVTGGFGIGRIQTTPGVFSIDRSGADSAIVFHEDGTAVGQIRGDVGLGNINITNDTGSNAYLSVDTNSGNVGIGTTSPTQKLTVDGNTTIQNGLLTERVLYEETWSGGDNNPSGDLGTWTESAGGTHSGVSAPPDGGNYFYLNNVNSYTLTSPGFSLEDYVIAEPGDTPGDTETYTQTRVFAKGWIYTDSMDNSAEYLVVEIFDGTTWHEVYRDQSNEDSGTDAGWKKWTADITPYINSGGDTQLRFRAPFNLGTGDWIGMGRFAIYESDMPTRFGNAFFGKTGLGLGTNAPVGQLHIQNDGSYLDNQVLISNGLADPLLTHPIGYRPALAIASMEQSASRPFLVGYQNANGWNGFVQMGACGAFDQMCFSMGASTTDFTALVSHNDDLAIGGISGAGGVFNNADGNFADVYFGNTGNIFMPNSRLQIGADSNSWIGDALTGVTEGFHTNDAAIFVPVNVSGLSDLRLYITDDDTDSFSVWGDSCGGGDCGNLDNASVVAHFQAGGNVGIGTSTPSVPLHVIGDITAESGTFSGQFMNLTGSASMFGLQVSNNITTPLGEGIIFADVDGVLKTDNSNLFWDQSFDRLGIQTNSPSIDLAIGDSDTGFEQDGDGQLSFRRNNTEVFRIDNDVTDRNFQFNVDNALAGDACNGNSEQLETSSNGHVRCGDEQVSDERLKNVVDRSILYGLDAVTSAEFIQYTWNELSGYATTTDGITAHQGFSAQNLLNVAPELVYTNEQGYYGLDQAGLIATAWNAIVELDAKVEDFTSDWYIDEDGNLGIGTDDPDAKLHVKDNAEGGVVAVFENGADGDGIVIEAGTSENPASTTEFITFKDGDGDEIGSIEGNGEGGITLTTAGADYAEYFKTDDWDLSAGEVVCVSVVGENSVERCTRAHDSNVMGIVSTAPAFLGNATTEKEDNPDYVVVAMLGQIPAQVSTENGAVQVGDALTAASLPGYAMKADPGDATVGVALETLQGGTTTPEYSTIQVLISRKNQSLTVEQVEAEVSERVAAMQIEDEVQRMVASTTASLNLDDDIQTIVDEELAKLDIETTITERITGFFTRFGLIHENDEIATTTATSTEEEEQPGWIKRVVRVAIDTIGDLGLRIVEGVVYARDIVVQRIVVDNITIGNSETPNGVTFFDPNGDPYCVRVLAGGALASFAGECGSEADAPSGTYGEASEEETTVKQEEDTKEDSNTPVEEEDEIPENVEESDDTDATDEGGDTPEFDSDTEDILEIDEVVGEGTEEPTEEEEPQEDNDAEEVIEEEDEETDDVVEEETIE